MSEATLQFTRPDLIPVVFGAQDRYLRQVREATGVAVVLKGDEVRLLGTDEQIKRSLQMFGELQSLAEKRGELADDDVRGIIRGESPSSVVSPRPRSVESGVQTFEKSKRVTPRTQGQSEYVQAMRQHDLVFCIGPAGSGKTYLAVAMAVNALRQELVRKIVLVRPAVEAGEKLGFLPGDLLAKVNPYMRPLLDALHEMLDFETVKRYMERDVIEVVPLAFMRGRTLNDTFIILDEGQNTTVTQMQMFLTRLGNGSRIVVTGDVTQIDLPSGTHSGMIDAVSRLKGIDGISTVELTGRDIVRHRLVRDIVRAYEVGHADPKVRNRH